MKAGIDYIGVSCCFVCHDGKGKILLGKRGENCRDENGRWDFGGGQVEHGESFEQTLRRELMEEYCVEPVSIKYIGTRNLIRSLDQGSSHWIANLHLVEVDPSQVQNGEPHKIDEIGWFDLDDLPEPMHSAVADQMEFVKEYLRDV
jgi:8-oxo-dGTP diphosphatase